MHMFNTQEVVRLLQAANPGDQVSEDRVRHAIRRGLVGPKVFASRLAWSAHDVLKLAQALNLIPPAMTDVSPRPVTAI